MQNAKVIPGEDFKLKKYYLRYPKSSSSYKIVACQIFQNYLNTNSTIWSEASKLTTDEKLANKFLRKQIFKIVKYITNLNFIAEKFQHTQKQVNLMSLLSSEFSFEFNLADSLTSEQISLLAKFYYELTNFVVKEISENMMELVVSRN